MRCRVGCHIRVRGPKGLTLSLGAWLKWGSAVRILLLLVVVVDETTRWRRPPAQHDATQRTLLRALRPHGICIGSHTGRRESLGFLRKSVGFLRES